jgi:tetratricopeptide (TPR) repeat protein
MINLIEGEDLVLVSWTGGVNFYLGNNELSTGLTVYSPEIKSVFSDQFSTITDIPESELGENLKKSQVSRFWLNKGLEYIKNNPLDWFKLMVKKKVLLFNNTEMANIYHFKAMGEFSPILNIPFPNYAFIFAFGIVGLIFVRKNLPDFCIPLLFIFTYSVIIIFFFVNTRYRIPVVPVLAIFTGYGIYSLYNFIREKRVKRLIVTSVVIIILSLFSYYNFYHIKELSQNRFAYYSNLGDIYRENDKTTEAVECYEKALNYPVQSPELNQSIHNRLGILYKNEGKQEKSFYHFKQSLSYIPSTIAYNHLALHHLEERELTRAEENLKKSLQLKPDNPTALHYYGLLSIYREDYQSAVDYLKRALENNPPSQSLNNIHYNLAISLLHTGETEQAREHLQKIEGDYADKEIILEELFRIQTQ